MSNKNKPEEMLNKTKEQFEKLTSNVDKEKIKSFGSKFSMKQLKNYTKILLVGSILFLGNLVIGIMTTIMENLEQSSIQTKIHVMQRKEFQNDGETKLVEKRRKQ